MAAPAAENPAAERAPLWRSVPAGLIRAATRAVWGLEVSGLEHVPRSGALIVAGNHVALIDGPLLALAVHGVRYMRFLGKAEVFRVPLLGWYLKKAGAIPLERGRADVAAMRAALGVLRGGGCMGLFPEGHRAKAGQPLPPRAGVGFLAASAGALVVPARLINTDRFPRRGVLEVRFGPGLRFAGDPAEEGSFQTFAEEVMRRVFSL